MRQAERARVVLEQVMFGARWLLAPIYVGLIVALGMLMVKFFQELLGALPNLLTMPTSDLIVELLSLIDLSLAANLLLMVMLAGYENFVSNFSDAGTGYRPRWLGHIDYGALKLKLVSSIIAIASVKMLEIYLDVKNITPQEATLHLAILLGFSLVAVLLALMDRLASGSDPH
jgi:uncharacterized protein (TIGR00645 family)